LRDVSPTRWDVAVYALSPEREIGIDVEGVRAIRDVSTTLRYALPPPGEQADRVVYPRDKPL